MAVQEGFGRRVREIMEEKDISNEELGERMQTSLRSVRRYTTEKKTPAMKTVKRIANALDVDVDCLISEIPYYKRISKTDNTSYDIAAAIISDYSHSWSDTQKSELIKSLSKGERS